MAMRANSFHSIAFRIDIFIREINQLMMIGPNHFATAVYTTGFSPPPGFPMPCFIIVRSVIFRNGVRYVHIRTH